MRVIVSSLPRAVALAKSLRDLLARENVHVTLTEAKRLVALILGYEDWAELRLVTERRGMTPAAFDEACEEGHAASRRAYQARRLGTHLGDTLPGGTVAAIVEALGACARPSRRWKAEASEPALVPPTGQALRPRAWLRMHGVDVEAEHLAEGAVRDALGRQLDRRWTGVEALARHERILAVAFGLFLVGRHRSSRVLLERQAVAHAGGVPDPVPDALVARHLADASLRQAVEAAASGHAYVATVLCRLLREARLAGGTVASAEFLWLKAIDRTLWYALNNVGRHAVHVEAAGISAHLDAERQERRPLPESHVGAAVAGIRAYLAAVGGEESDGPHASGFPRLRANHFVRLAA